MADLGKNLKNIWMKSMEAIGNTASNIATNTKYKVDEMNLLNRRREILNDFGAKAYALWQKGECGLFPEELKKDMEELSKLDNQLVDMRAEHFAGEDAEPAQEDSAEKAPEEAEAEPDEAAEEKAEASAEPGEEVPAGTETEADIPAEPVPPEDAEEELPVNAGEAMDQITEEASSIQEAINDLFDQIPSVDTMAAKMNDTLDQMGNNLKKFSDDLDGQLEDLTNRLTGSEPPKQE